VSSLKRLKQRNALASELRHCLQPKARDPEVLYNVGAVLRHLKFGWHGVVCGYDDTCAMPDPWLEQNYSPTGQKHDIEVVRRSPFYSLACNDGIHRYASQLTHELVEGNSAAFFGLSESDAPEPPQLTGEKDRQFVDSVASALREGKPGFIADPFKIWLSPAQSKHMIARYFVGYSREDGTFLPNEHLAAKYPDP
jgi:hemimethylated DNA binding protein